MKNVYQGLWGNSVTFDFEAKKTALQEAVKCLPVDQQIIIYYHFYDSLSIKEIAQKLNCAETTVHTKIKKALYNLRRQLNPSYYKKAMEILYGKLPNYISY
ncbi:MAG: RNA polymerase sigma factor [Chitinophagaceae bacterium]